MAQSDSNSDQRDWLLDQRKLLNEHRVEQHAFFDRSLLTLASGAIGLSLPLATYFSADGNMVATYQLGYSWAALSVSLCTNLISYLTGARDAMREIQAIDDELSTGQDTAHRNNPDRNLTSILNYTSLITFMVGTVFMLLFAYANAV